MIEEKKRKTMMITMIIMMITMIIMMIIMTTIIMIMITTMIMKIIKVSHLTSNLRRQNIFQSFD